MSVGSVVEVRGLHRTYHRGADRVHALRGVELVIPRGQIVAVRGRSGAGKTTLLNCIAGLDVPDSGAICVAGHDLGTAGEDLRLRLRRETIGMVFQDFALIPILSARENVGIPLRLLAIPAPERERRVRDLLDAVGLADHLEQRPHELSGGQQQRVAVARALVAQPDLLLADEPTGQLDSATARSIINLITAMVRERGGTALITTHDQAVAANADRVLDLHDGRFTAPPAVDDATGPSSSR